MELPIFYTIDYFVGKIIINEFTGRIDVNKKNLFDMLFSFSFVNRFVYC